MNFGHTVVIKDAYYNPRRVLWLQVMDPATDDSGGTYTKLYEWVVSGSGHTWAQSLVISDKLRPTSVDVAYKNAFAAQINMNGWGIPEIEKTGLSENPVWDGVRTRK